MEIDTRGKSSNAPHMALSRALPCTSRQSLLLQGSRRPVRPRTCRTQATRDPPWERRRDDSKRTGLPRHQPLVATSPDPIRRRAGAPAWRVAQVHGSWRPRAPPATRGRLAHTRRGALRSYRALGLRAALLGRRWSSAGPAPVGVGIPHAIPPPSSRGEKSPAAALLSTMGISTAVFAEDCNDCSPSSLNGSLTLVRKYSASLPTSDESSEADGH